MIGFTYSSPTHIVFGTNTVSQVGTLMKPYAKKVLLHYGGGSVKRNGVYDTVVTSLKEAGIAIVELGGVVPNPRYSMVETGIELCKKEQPDAILAVGGGSVIDSAKAIAGGYYLEGEDLWEDYFVAHRKVTKALPLGVVLTIPAAGSETNSGTVITNDVTHYKMSMGANCLIPKFAIIDPSIHVSLSKYQTACGCADIIAHLLERYFTNTKRVDYTDRLLEASLQTVIYNLPRVLENPNDVDGRAELAWCGTLAHNGLLGKGREEDWASHGLQHELGAIYDINHGEGLAVMFPAWMKYVWKQDPKRFVQYATRVWGVQMAEHDEEAIVMEGIYRTEQFFKRCGLRTRLSEMDIDDTKFEEMAEKFVFCGKTGKFVKLTKEDAVEIYRLAQ
ncbi:MAG: iron-containing alcohol dehydrogenase [Erysipelotrichaceae bacterium]|nr:iron-containing alcohol dehydrogenase [Erysipelotrichaceae bacterium]